VPFGNDGDFSRQAMIHRMNGDLANDLGNLSQRVLSMIFKNCDGKMPALPAAPTPEDMAILGAADALLATVRTTMDQQAFHEGLRHIWQVVADANRYVDAMAPWGLKKTDPAAHAGGSCRSGRGDPAGRNPCATRYARGNIKDA
jgi:methionyl-tRNA synthetase